MSGDVDIYLLFWKPFEIWTVFFLLENWFIIGHGRSTHVGIREGENGHGGLEKRERVVRGRWKGNPDT